MDNFKVFAKPPLVLSHEQYLTSWCCFAVVPQDFVVIPAVTVRFMPMDLPIG